MDTLVVYGTSENVEAEYGQRADEAFTLLLIVDDTPVSIEGYNNRKALMVAKRDCAGARFECLL